MSVVGVRVPISSRSIEGRDASILFCSFLAFAYADNGLRPMSPRCLQQSSTEKRPRLVAAVGCSSSNAEQQYLDFAFYSSDAFYMVLQLGCIRVSDASERSKNVRAHWDLPRPRLACLVALTKLRFAHAHTRVQHARYARCVPALACESRS